MDIQKIMDRIINREKPQVFRVGVFRTDHQVGYMAMATFRGDERSIDVWDKSPRNALLSLEEMLDGMVCPHCGAVKEN